MNRHHQSILRWTCFLARTSSEQPYCRKSQTSTVSPAKPGVYPLELFSLGSVHAWEILFGPISRHIKVCHALLRNPKFLSHLHLKPKLPPRCASVGAPSDSTLHRTDYPHKPRACPKRGTPRLRLAPEFLLWPVPQTLHLCFFKFPCP